MYLLSQCDVQNNVILGVVMLKQAVNIVSFKCPYYTNSQEDLQFDVLYKVENGM